MAEQQIVAVTGASGFVGRHVVRELLSRGHRVRGLVRDRQKARDNLPATGSTGLELVVGDVFDSRALAGLAAGADALVHLVGIIREKPGMTFKRAHVDATAAVLRAAAESGVKRYLHMSALNVSDMGISEYQTTKFEGERLVRRSGLEWTIFRPGLIYGEGGEFVDMMLEFISGHHPPYFFMPYFTRWRTDTTVPLGGRTAVNPVVSPVAVGDVARAFGAALEKPGTVGEIYNLVGAQSLGWPEMLRTFRDTLPDANERLQPWGIPSDSAALVAKAARRLGLGGLLPFDEGMAKMGGQDATATLDKARAHLGIEFRPFREGFREFAAAQQH